jgi:hypothetical protein
VAAIDAAEHRGDERPFDFAASERDALVEQAQAVAHAARRRTRDRFETGRIERDALCATDLLELRLNLSRRKTFEVELQTTRQHGDR